MNRLCWSFVPAAFFAATLMQAQDAPVVKAKSWEVGGYGGFTRGEGKTSGLFGANFGYAFSKAIFPYAEFNYFPNMSRRLNVDSALFNSSGYQTSVTEVNTGLHYRFAPRPGSKFVPYLIGGVGFLRYPAGSTVIGVKRPGAADLQNAVSVDGTTGASINGGAGLRIYINERFGFRTEVKMYKPFVEAGRLSGISSGTVGLDKAFTRVAFGIFWQSN